MKYFVHKFGGTSLANSDRYRAAAKLLDQNGKLAVVVSAMAQVTDTLLAVAEAAKNQNPIYLEKLAALEQRHLQTAQELLTGDEFVSFKQILQDDFEKLKEILRGLWHVKSHSERTLELISGHGEIWSAQLFNAFLRATGAQSFWLDARKVLVVEPGETSVSVVWEESQNRVNEWLKQNPSEILVITGFIASTQDGSATTLRRNGSDYSASIFAALLNAEAITIWTDVDGVLSADPRLVPEAIVLEDMSYMEATELAYFGAKVIHPSTMAPAIRKQIPIWIKNTFSPQAKGTLIHSTSQSQVPVKGFATVDHLALINVEGTGMVGVPGVAQRLFGSLKEVGVSVVMISQASSEHSICFAVPNSQAHKAKAAVEAVFAFEIRTGLIQNVDLSENCSILAAVGDNMAQRTGIAGKFMTALGRAGVSIRAIAQGSSERNISVVIAGADSTRALRAVHSAFFLSNYTLSVGLIGTGGVGHTFLAQLQEAAQRLKHDSQIDLRVRAIADSKRMLLHELEINLSHWKKNLQESDLQLNLKDFSRHVRSEHLPHAVVIDCTASTDIAQLYPQWLKMGLHVITPNKKANTLSIQFYQELKQAAEQSQRHYLYETTVGAGLPIINSLRELVKTGDQILQIEGILSGTLSYIFNSFSAERTFSSVVLEAKKRGYTEPDPRDDLSGVDVARKLVILAREMGKKIELSDVKIEAFLPSELQTGSVEQFLTKLPQFDELFLKKLQTAQARGQVLRFVGRIGQDGTASVALHSYPAEHAFARISGTDNIVAFRTRRYSQPLIVQGPGAGPEVTAAGVFADLLRLSSYLGAPL
jgi:aspartokinase/homoserine dehydrogenase 1